MNGPLKFLSVAKFKRVLLECSLARAPQIFAVARMLAFLSVVLLEILWILLWIKVNVILCGA